MTRFPSAAQSNRTMPRLGLSLLEVIIATAILAGSAMMLMSMFSMGDRHTTRAEQQLMAQMLCQSKLDEVVADPAQLVPMQADVFRDFPNWVWSVDVKPAAIDGLVLVKVGVTRIPGMSSGADLPVSSDSESSEETFASQLPDRPTFELTRWLRHDAKIAETDGLDGPTSLLERLQSRQR